MERAVCAALQFKLTMPTPFPFLARMLDVSDADELTRHAAHFFLEHAALDYKSLQFLPSQLAAASLYLANVTLRKAEPWTPALQHYSRARVGDFRACARQLLEFVNFVPSTKYQAIRRKYGVPKFGDVAKLMMPNEVPE